MFVKFIYICFDERWAPKGLASINTTGKQTSFSSLKKTRINFYIKTIDLIKQQQQ